MKTIAVHYEAPVRRLLSIAAPVAVIMAAATFFFTYSVTDARARGYACKEAPAVSAVEADETETHRALICQAARRAIAFLGSYNLEVRQPIVIDIVEGLIDNSGYSAYGSYDSRSDRISLMSLASIMKSSEAPMMYDEQFDAEHYIGAAAHEIAHAVVQHNLQAKPISPGPQEYLAHATQLAALSAERRENIIAAQDIDPWLPGDTISDIYMALQPTRFAVKSYLHLTSLEHPEEFVTILLRSNWFYVYVPE